MASFDLVVAGAGIEVLQRGAIVIARRAEALAVLEQFAAGEMGRGCEIQSTDETCRQLPHVVPGIAGSLTSPHEMRVEAREALPKLARWLEERLGVTFLWGTPVLGIEGESVRHAGGYLGPARSSWRRDRPWRGSRPISRDAWSCATASCR